MRAGACAVPPREASAEAGRRGGARAQKEWREDRDGYKKKVARCVRQSQECM